MPHHAGFTHASAGPEERFIPGDNFHICTVASGDYFHIDHYCPGDYFHAGEHYGEAADLAANIHL